VSKILFSLSLKKKKAKGLTGGISAMVKVMIGIMNRDIAHQLLRPLKELSRHASRRSKLHQ